ncbi:MAG: outer membrane beta-barrel protein [Candidatus Omnitrophica bacterium]|nr:outer membrane beta-barrel protein [Candidatus Omnitrophota bacterium]
MKKVKILPIIFIMGGCLCCYGEITRKDIVSYNLDYYSLKMKEEAENLKLKEELKKEKKQEIKIQQSKERKEKVSRFLKKVQSDFAVKIVSENKYTDNLYKTHRDHVNAFIETVDVAIKYRPKFFWRQGHTSLGFDINGGPDTNITKKNVFIKGKGKFNTLLKHTRGKYTFGLKFGLGKDYSSLTDIKTEAIIPESLIDYWKRLYGATLNMDFNRIPTDITYTHTDDLYEKRYNSSNTSTDKISLTNYFKVFPKTSLLTSFDYTVDNSPKRPGARIVSYTWWGGIHGKLTPKITGLVKAGYRFENPKRTENTDTQTINLNLDYKMFNRLFHTFSVDRNVQTTAYENEYWVKTTKFQLVSTYLPPFSKRLRFLTNLAFTDYSYSSERKDKLYQMSLGATYALKNKLNISAKYEFEYKNSDKVENDYEVNTITLRLTKEF